MVSAIWFCFSLDFEGPSLSFTSHVHVLLSLKSLPSSL